MPALRSARVRFALVAIASVTYAAFRAVLTVQALIGQSIVRPDATIITISATIACLAIIAATLVVVRGAHAAHLAKPSNRARSALPQ